MTDDGKSRVQLCKITSPLCIDMFAVSTWAFSGTEPVFVAELGVVAGTKTDEVGGSFAFELRFGPEGEIAKEVLATVTVPAGMDRGIIKVDKHVPTNSVFVAVIVAIGGFPILTAVQLKEFSLYMNTQYSPQHIKQSAAKTAERQAMMRLATFWDRYSSGPITPEHLGVTEVEAYRVLKKVLEAYPVLHEWI